VGDWINQKQGKLLFGLRFKAKAKKFFGVVLPSKGVCAAQDTDLEVGNGLGGMRGREGRPLKSAVQF
jgi:hypothetical protein